MRLLLAMIGFLLMANTAHGYDEPAYEVTEQFDSFELRRYGGYLVAETEASGDFGSSRNAAFRRLFRYIAGDNAVDERIDMTVPVTTRSGGEKIAMTVPVTTSDADSGTLMQFVLPSKYTVDDAPRPLDEQIRIRAVPPQWIAARRYSGRSNQANYQRERAVLLEAVQAAGLTAVGEPMLAVYNGPFTPWFMRRNEALIAVAAPQE